MLIPGYSPPALTSRLPGAIGIAFATDLNGCACVPSSVPLAVASTNTVLVGVMSSPHGGTASHVGCDAPSPGASSPPASPASLPPPPVSCVRKPHAARHITSQNRIRPDANSIVYDPRHASLAARADSRCVRRQAPATGPTNSEGAGAPT